MQPRQQATLTQPLQCVSQHSVANLHISTHMATPDDNNQPAIPLRSATIGFKKRKELRTQEQTQPPHTRGTFHRRLQPLYTEKYKVSCSGFVPNISPMQHSCSHYNAFRSIVLQTCTSLRTWQHQMTTINQPFHCDLQPQIQDTHRTKHTGTTTRCRTQRRNPPRPERPQPQPPHTRGTFHRRLQPLYKEKYKVSCSGFLPNTSPMQHSCSHCNAFRRIVLQTCTYLRTWQHQMTTINQPFHCHPQPQIQDTHRTKHTDTTTRCRTQRRNPSRPERPQPQPPHRRGTFHRRLQPLYTEKYKVSCSGFLPNTSPMQHSCSHYNAFRSIVLQTCTSLRT